jgi:hypothetical protein
MKGLYLFITLLLLTAPGAFAQTDITNARIAMKKAAERMGWALVNKEYMAFMKTTHPKAIEMAEGGLEKMAQRLQSQVEGMERNANKIIAAWPGEPSAIIDTAGELQSTIPQKMKIELENGKIITETTLLAMSPDNGVSWYFMDANDRDIATIRKTFPNFSSKLVLKKNPEGIFEPLKEPATSKKPKAK